MSDRDPRDAVAARLAAVWRLESRRIVGAVARRVRDLGVAEEIAQECLVTALERWPVDGVPDNPAAWLTTAALRRALDHLRHHKMATGHHEALAGDLLARGEDRSPDVADALDDRRHAAWSDDLLRLLFTACHPALPLQTQLPLALKVVCGLETREVARVMLVSEATLAQRLVRAGRTLAQAEAGFELPADVLRSPRLAAVREVVRLLFTEGHSAGSGAQWTRPALCDEALRLARMLAVALPDDPETLGLLALLELQASRLPARLDAAGRPVLLDDQDRRRWDRLLITRGLAVLERARGLVAARGEAAGPLQLQAELAAVHARATRAEDTDWPRLAAVYAALESVAPSPVVTLNRAVAVGRAEGPAAGLALLGPLLEAPALQRYPWLPAVQGDLLERLGDRDAALAAFERARALAGNDHDRALMAARVARLTSAGP